MNWLQSWPSGAVLLLCTAFHTTTKRQMWVLYALCTNKGLKMKHPVYVRCVVVAFGSETSVWVCRWYTHTKSQMMQAPSELEVTHSLSSLLILIQVTVALCSFMVSSSWWPGGCSSQTRTYNRWTKTHQISNTSDVTPKRKYPLCLHDF